jgi:hypothetical protein
MDNISKFIKFCRDYGVPPVSLFTTVDLYESKDLGAVVACLHALSDAAAKNGFEGPFVAAKDPSALSQVAKSHLEIIVAVGEAKQRHAAELAKCEDPVERAVLEREHSDIINEAVDYRLAMLGLSDEALPENVRGVDRAQLGDAYLVVYSSSTKMSRARDGANQLRTATSSRRRYARAGTRGRRAAPRAPAARQGQAI